MVAPAIEAHARPSALQRSHCRVKPIGVVPCHDPMLETVRVCPWRGTPPVEGSTVLTGAAPSTTPVAIEVATPVPSALVAVTCRRIVDPTSVLFSASVGAVPARVVQLAPAASQRIQRRAKLIGAVPVHVPSLPASVSPSRSVPATDGATVLTGAARGPISADGGEVCVAAPSAFVAVTTARTVPPTSATVTR